MHWRILVKQGFAREIRRGHLNITYELSPSIHGDYAPGKSPVLPLRKV